MQSWNIMAQANLTLITPTIGRSTLKRICTELQSQMSPTDQYIVVGDGPRPSAQALIESLADSRFVYAETAPTGHWGSEQCDHAITLATGDYLLFLGDDDEVLPNALESVRSIVSLTDPHPYLFGIVYCNVPMSRQLAPCACSGQQFVPPNNRTHLASYSSNGGETNDWHFMTNTINTH